MSNFNCPHCGKALMDTPIGYITECEHYPLDDKLRTLAIAYCNTRIDYFTDVVRELEANRG